MGDSPSRKGKRKSPDQTVEIVPKKQNMREEPTAGVISRALSHINSFGILSNRTTTKEKPTATAFEPSGIGGGPKGSKTNDSSGSSANESGSISSVNDLTSDDEDLENEVTDSDSNSDSISLRPKKCLNDNVIDVALSLTNKTNDVHVFNSQFFAKLRTISESDEIPKDFYAGTSAWFKNKQLRDRRFWLIPVCDK
ncbi:hypothetical protein INT47_007180 [Mucor saturninus]|uniref:Ubiquitin-like protease family profile domain-containing protein n=1 Tax=Mucor saturninus TaxID=64648 RepID=A0A8H7R830_9FUNG|nr:hypothetical protein INT47_007180 [Mucor saturninus]